MVSFVRWRLGFTLLALLVSLTANSPSLAASPSAQVLVVSPDGNDAAGTGRAASPYRTIAHAVLVAPPGATIVVRPGTYPTMVELTKPVTLESDARVSDAVATTVIDATGQPHGIWIHGPAAAGTIVRGLTVKNANDQAILVEDTSRVVIEGNLVTDNALHPGVPPAAYQVMAEDKAIQLQGTTNVVVEHNTVTRNRHGGIAILDSPARPAVGNRIVANRIITNQGDCGVVIASYVPGQGVRNNVVEQNLVQGNIAGVVIAANPPGTTAINNVVSANRIIANQLPGVIIHSNARDQIVSGTVISDNRIRENGADPAVQLREATGIAIIGAIVPVTKTTLRNNTISGEAIAVWQYNPTAQPLLGRADFLRRNGPAIITAVAGSVLLLVLLAWRRPRT